MLTFVSILRGARVQRCIRSFIIHSALLCVSLVCKASGETANQPHPCDHPLLPHPFVWIHFQTFSLSLSLSLTHSFLVSSSVFFGFSFQFVLLLHQSTVCLLFLLYLSGLVNRVASHLFPVFSPSLIWRWLAKTKKCDLVLRDCRHVYIHLKMHCMLY